jgi:uncharacterized membrane protein
VSPSAGSPNRWLLTVLVFANTLLYSALSILRHRHFESGWDLAIFDQAVWLYSRFQAPEVTVRFNQAVNILGDHFHPIIALLAPLFWIADTVESLLVGQAFLLAVSAIPVFLFTRRRLGIAAAWLFALSYSVYWGLQTAAEFEFHEIVFAVPLIAFAVYFIDVGNRKAYLACLALLLITKEDMPAMVAFFGLYLLLRHQYKDGLISFSIGVLCFPLFTRILIPYFAGGRPYDYWTYEALGSDLWSALKNMARRPGLVVQSLISPEVKLRTMWLLFSPFLFLSLLSPILLLMVPILAERFLSSRPMFWDPYYHHNAAIAPLIALAAADGLARIARVIKAERARHAVVILLSLAILSINVYMVTDLPLWRLTSSDYRRLSEKDRDGQAAVSVIPAGVTVAAQVPIASHLTHRRGMYVIYPNMSAPDCEYVIVSNHVTHYPFASFQEIENYYQKLQERGYVKIFDRNGWIVLKKAEQ